ncbi:MAG TPA: DUF924 family protein [Wenzhouxiangella sp.]|nr:DUF924 family protein [Wenzhouxiangella sp.]
MTVRPGDLLEYWFGPAAHDAGAIDERMGLWFKPTRQQDEQVREVFEATMKKAAAGALTEWLVSARGRLAMILALDQAPRVIYRGQAQAFAHDSQALALALAGLMNGADRELGLAERAFFYLPLEHSEDRLAQRLSVQSYERLAADFPDHPELTASFLKYAREHADVIERFGRFPHRNRALGRTSTAEERAFLEDAPRWGQ